MDGGGGEWWECERVGEEEVERIRERRIEESKGEKRRE